MPSWFGLSRRKYRALRRLPAADRWLLVETVTALGLARLAVRLVPFRRLAPYLGAVGQETPTQRAGHPDLERLAVALHHASRHTPWRSRCLEQAIAAKLMLRRRRLPSTLYLGVHKQDRRLEAHAWLRCGDRIVTGAHGMQRYRIVSCYGEPQP